MHATIWGTLGYPHHAQQIGLTIRCFSPMGVAAWDKKWGGRRQQHIEEAAGGFRWIWRDLPRSGEIWDFVPGWPVPHLVWDYASTILDFVKFFASFVQNVDFVVFQWSLYGPLHPPKSVFWGPLLLWHD